MKISWRERREVANLMAVLSEEQTRVAQRLARLREAHALTQEAAAARAGVTLRQWQRWESGASEPYARNIAKISDEFKIPLAELVGSETSVASETQLDRIEGLLQNCQSLLLMAAAPDALERLVADAAVPLLATAALQEKKARGEFRSRPATRRRKSA